jgi:hypothetical protein
VSGKAPDAATHVTLTLAQLREAIIFDITWLVSRLGVKLVKQRFGFPMGRAISHPLSVGLCAWDEYNFRLTLGADAHYLRLKRYVDDANAVVFYRRDGASPTRSEACALLARWRAHCYDSNLVLEKTATSDSEYEFLDGYWTLSQEDLAVYIRNRDRNLASFLASGQRPIVRFQHFHSFVPTRLLRGVVISALIRLSRNSSKAEDFIASAHAYWLELERLKYPRSMFREAVDACGRNAPHDPLWIAAANSLALFTARAHPPRE